MKCNVKRSRKTGEILQVKARNDQPSNLFATLEERYGNRETAVEKYSNTYLPRFAEKINPKNDILLATVMMDDSLSKQDLSTINKIRKLDKSFNKLKFWSAINSRLFQLENKLGEFTFNIPAESKTLEGLSKNINLNSIPDTVNTKLEAEMILAYELGFIKEEDVLNYYSDFESSINVERKLPSIQEMLKYVYKKQQEASIDTLISIAESTDSVTEASKILRLLENPDTKYVREGIYLYLGETLSELMKNNPILESIDQIDSLQEKSEQILKRGQHIHKQSEYLGLFNTEEINKKLDDNFDPILSVYDSNAKFLEGDEYISGNKEVGRTTDSLDILEAKEKLASFINPDSQLSKNFEVVLDNMKSSGQLWSTIYEQSIYLNDKLAKLDNNYNEAFRYAFRHFLKPSESSALINEAKKQVNYTKEELLNEVQNLRNGSSTMMNADTEVLVNSVYENYIAKEYMKFALKGNPAKESFAEPFEKMFNFISQLPDYRSQTKALFHKINARGFLILGSKSENNLEMGKIAFKQIKTGDKPVTRDGEPILINGKVQREMSYATASESTKIINNTAAIIHMRMQELGVITDEAVDELFNNYFEEQSLYYTTDFRLKPENRELVAKAVRSGDKNFLSKLRSYETIYKDVDNRKIIRDEVKKLFKILSFNPVDEEMENSLNESATIEQIAKKSAYELGGYQMTDRELRQFISFSTYEDKDPITGELRPTSVDGSVVFSALVRAMASRDLGTGEEFMKELFAVSRDQKQSKAVFEKLAKITGFGTPAFNEDHSIIRLFKKNLDMERIHFLTALFDPENQKYKLWSAGRKDLANLQIENWKKNWNDSGLVTITNDPIAAKDLKDGFTVWENFFQNIAPQFINQLDQKFIPGTNTVDPNGSSVLDILMNGGTFDWKDIAAKEVLSVTVPSLEQLTGIKLSRGYMRYNILKYTEFHLANETGSELEGRKKLLEYLAMIKDNNPDIDFYLKYDTKNIPVFDEVAGENVSFITMLKDAMFKTSFKKLLNDDGKEIRTEDKYNPFLEHTEGLTSSMTKLAEANANFDETLSDTSFQDATGNTRHSFIQKSYQAVFTRRMQTRAFRNELKNDPDFKEFLSSNKLLKHGDGILDSIFDDKFLFYYYGDIRQTGAIEKGNRNNVTEERQGATPKDIDIKSWVLNQILLFTERETIEGTTAEGEKFNVTRSYFSPKVFETKTTHQALLLPLGKIHANQGVYSYIDNSDYSSHAIDDIMSMLDNEIKLNQKTHNEIFELGGLEAYTNWLRDGISIPDGVPNMKENIHIITDENGEIEYRDKKRKIDLSKAFGRGHKLWNFETVLNLTGGALKQYYDNMKKLREEEIKRFIPSLITQYDALEVARLKKEISKFNLKDHRDSVEKGIREFLANEYDVLIKKLVNYGIVYTDSKGTIQNKLMPKEKIKELGYKDETDFLKDWFINHYINVQEFNNLIDKAPFVRKNSVDAVKRNGGSVAYGPSLGEGQFRAAFIKEPRDTNKLGNPADIADGQAWMTIDRLKLIVSRLGLGTTKINEIYDRIRLGEEIEWEDLKKLEAVNSAINPKKGVFFNGVEYFKLSYLPLSYSFTSRVKLGKEERRQELAAQITELERNLSDGSIVNQTIKNERREQLKEMWNEYEDLWEAKSGREILHNMRKQMREKNIDEVLPESASKLRTSIPASLKDGVYNFDYSTTTLQNENWRLQVVTPSGKGKITYFSQVLQLIDNEQLNKDVIVNIQGVNLTVGQAIKIYRDKLAKRVRNSVEAALMEIADLDEAGEFISKNAREMQEKMRETLEESGADDSLLEFFRNTTADGTDFEYDPNLPSVRNKFEQLFLAHFSKGVLQQKVPGRKVTLASDYGINVIVDSNDNVVPQLQLVRFREKYYDENGQLLEGLTSRRLKWSERQYELKDTNVTIGQMIVLINSFAKTENIEDALEQVDEETRNYVLTDLDILSVEIGQRQEYLRRRVKENTIEKQQSLSEVMMPAWRAEMLGFTAGDVITKENKEAWESIMRMFGSRIPSQDKHSMIAFKIVDFLPVEYGDVAVFPYEIMELSGADFDIDSLFSIHKDFYTIFDSKKKQKVIRVFGEFDENEVEDSYKNTVGEDNYTEGDGLANYAWAEYKNYLLSRNSKVKRKLQHIRQQEKYTTALISINQQLRALMQERDTIKVEKLKVLQDSLFEVRQKMGLLPVSRSEAKQITKDYKDKLKEITEAIASDPVFNIVGDAYKLSNFVGTHSSKDRLVVLKQQHHDLWEREGGLSEYYKSNSDISKEYLSAKADRLKLINEGGLDVSDEQVLELDSKIAGILADQEYNNTVTYGKERIEAENIRKEIADIYSQMTNEFNDKYKFKSPKKVTHETYKKAREILDLFDKSDYKKDKKSLVNEMKKKEKEIEEANSTNEHYADFKRLEKEVEKVREELAPIFDKMQPLRVKMESLNNEMLEMAIRDAQVFGKDTSKPLFDLYMKKVRKMAKKDEVVESSTEQIADYIYKKLGDKTQSKYVEIPGKGDLSGVEYNPKTFWSEVVPEARGWFGDQIIIAYRGNHKKTFDENFKSNGVIERPVTIGNPFDWQNESGTREEKGVISTKKFIHWMITGNNMGVDAATEAYRQSIISNIKSGELKGRGIIYYEEKGYATHATALDYLINEYDWETPIEQQMEETKQSSPKVAQKEITNKLTKKDFNNLNNSSISNLLVELNIALYTNSGVSEITMTPASMTKLQGGTMSDGREVHGLSNILTELITEIKKAGNYEYNTLGGQIIAKESNTMGDSLIGPSANATVVKAALSRTGVDVLLPTIKFDGMSFQTFSNYQSKDIQFEVTKNSDGSINNISIVEGKSTVTVKDLPSISSEVLVFGDDNVRKILAGTKTTTIRTDSSFIKIGIETGHAAITNIGGKKFIIMNRGKMSVEQAGGVDVMLKSEDYESIDSLRFDHSKAFMRGERDLYVYDILDYETNKDTFRLDFERSMILSDERIMDELSTILSAMTDNAKHNDASKLNFSLNNIGTFLYMISLGMGLNRAGLLAAQPILRHRNRLQSSQGSAIQSREESSFFNSESITERLIGADKSHAKGTYTLMLEAVNEAWNKITKNEEFESRVDQLPPVKFAGETYINAIELFKAKAYDKQGEGKDVIDNHLNSKALLDSLKLDKDLKENHGLSISDTDFIYLIENNKFSLEELAKLKVMLRTQFNAMRAFSRLDQQRKYFSAVKNFLNLNTGLDPSFGDQIELKEAFKLFHINENELRDYVKDPNKLFDKKALKDDKDLLFSVEKLMMQNDDVYETTHSFARVMDLAKQYVISQTPFFTQSIERLFEHTIPSIRDEARVKSKAINNLIAFVSNQAFKNYLQNKSGRKSVLFNPELLYSGPNSLLSRMNKIVEKHKLGSNAFINLLIRTQGKVSNKDLNLYNTQNSKAYGYNFEIEIDDIGTNTRTKQTPEFVSAVMSGYRELMSYSDMDVRDWADDAFNYLIVKDGLLFSNNSYLKYIAPEKFSDLSDVYKRLLKAFKDNQWKSTTTSIGLEDILGMDRNEVESTFYSLFARDYNNKDMFRLINGDKFVKGIGEKQSLERRLERAGFPGAVSFEYDYSHEYGEKSPSKIHIDLTGSKFQTWHQAYLNREDKDKNDQYYFDTTGDTTYLISYEDAIRIVPNIEEKYRSKESYDSHWKAVAKEFTDKLKLLNKNAKLAAAREISYASDRVIVLPAGDKFVGLNFPLYFTMNEALTEEDEFGNMVQKGESTIALYMLTNTEAGTLLENPDPNLLVKQTGTYTKIPFINTHMYSYLDKPSEYQSAMSNLIISTVEKLTEEDEYANYSKIQSLLGLNQYLLDQDFSVSLFEQFKGGAKEGKVEKGLTKESAEKAIFNDSEYVAASAEKNLTAEEIASIKNGNRKVILRDKPIEGFTKAGRTSFIKIGEQVYTVENAGQVNMSEVANALDIKSEVKNNMSSTINFSDDTADMEKDWLDGRTSMVAYIVKPHEGLTKPALAIERPNFGINEVYIGITPDRFRLRTTLEDLGVGVEGLTNKLIMPLDMHTGDMMNKGGITIIFTTLNPQGEPTLETSIILKRAGIDTSAENFDADYSYKENKKILLINPSGLSNANFDFSALQNIVVGDNTGILSVLSSEKSTHDSLEFFTKLLHNPNAQYSIKPKGLKDSPSTTKALELLRKAGYNITVADLLKKGYFDVNPAVLLQTNAGIKAYNYIMQLYDANKQQPRYKQIQREVRNARGAQAEDKWHKKQGDERKVLKRQKFQVQNTGDNWNIISKKYGLEPTVVKDASLEKADALFAVTKFEYNQNPQAPLRLKQNSNMDKIKDRAIKTGIPVYVFDQQFGKWFTYDIQKGMFEYYKVNGQTAIPQLTANPFMTSETNVDKKGLMAMMDLFDAEAKRIQAESGEGTDILGSKPIRDDAKSKAIAEIKNQKIINGTRPDCK